MKLIDPKTLPERQQAEVDRSLAAAKAVAAAPFTSPSPTPPPTVSADFAGYDGHQLKSWLANVNAAVVVPESFRAASAAAASAAVAEDRRRLESAGAGFVEKQSPELAGLRRQLVAVEQDLALASCSETNLVAALRTAIGTNERVDAAEADLAMCRADVVRLGERRRVLGELIGEASNRLTAGCKLAVELDRDQLAASVQTDLNQVYAEVLAACGPDTVKRILHGRARLAALTTRPVVGPSVLESIAARATQGMARDGR